MFENDQIMNKASNVLRVMSDDDRMREAARMREKRLHDEATYLATARAEGRAEGRSEGIAEGWAEGLAAGKINTLIELVRNGVISLQIAASQASMSESEFEALCANR